jgi:hypothetical protein
MHRHIILPNYLRDGIKPMKKGFPSKLRLIVADTETVLGDPYTIQLFDGETALYSHHKTEDILHTFVKYIRKRMAPGYQNYCYFHGLDFDLPVLLHDYHDRFSENYFFLEIPSLSVSFECFTGKMTFAKMYTPEGMCYIYDTLRFVMASLEKACEDLHLAHKKLPRPSYLGTREPLTEEEPSFRAYAMADVYALWELVLWKMERVQEQDISIPISIAQMASFVFRKRFMPPKTKINFPPLPCVIDSILAYHGGKNGLYTPTPALLRDVSSYDINSAYPWAMKMLPSFLGGTYKQVRKFSDKYVGIYAVSGEYTYDTYHLFFHHNFEKHPPGRVENLCVTSFELERAISLGWFKPEKIRGWIFVPETNEYSPLAGYVDYFYEQKQRHEKTDAQYWIAKYLLNSLYGKFIQSTDYNAAEGIVARVKEGKIEHLEKESIAGGLFQPFLASLITGAVRTKLHGYEVDYHSLHSSTDSILTKVTIPTETTLGGLKLENKGDVLLIRNKLLLHTNKERFEVVAKKAETATKKEQSKIWGKFALHGFQGDIPNLIRLWKTRSNAYEIDRMVKLKESFKNKNLHLKPLMFHHFDDKTLDVDWSQYTEEK